MPMNTPSDLRQEMGSLRNKAAMSITINGLVAETSDT